MTSLSKVINMVISVDLSSDVYLVCLSHALSTEKEEVMGLLLGEMKENKTAYICSAYPMRRSDKRKDRVEISPEQLSAAAIEAEQLASKLKRPIQVLGWYHSHPHITLWPSHVDIRTQADYQLLDPNFIGLIFSCFNESDKKISHVLQLVCFQSGSRGAADQSFERIELPVRVVPTNEATLSPMCVSAITRIPTILFEEERETYFRAQRHCKDLLTAIHNSGVYTQSLSHLLQIVGGPVIQLLEEEIQRNTANYEKLQIHKEQLLAILSDTESDSEV